MGKVKATHIALNANRLALEAIEEKKRREQEVLDLVEQTKRDRAAETLKHALHLLSSEKWFPGVEWNVRDDRSGHGSAMGYGHGEAVVLHDANDPHNGWQLMYERFDNSSNGGSVIQKVYWVTSETDSGTGYGYWGGPEVKSAADVGAILSHSKGLG